MYLTLIRNMRGGLVGTRDEDADPGIFPRAMEDQSS